MRGLGNLTLRSVKGPKRTNWRILRLFLVVYSSLKDGALTTVKRDTAFLTNMRRGYRFSIKGIPKGHLSFLKESIKR